MTQYSVAHCYRRVVCGWWQIARCRDRAAPKSAARVIRAVDNVRLALNPRRPSVRLSVAARIKRIMHSKRCTPQFWMATAERPGDRLMQMAIKARDGRVCSVGRRPVGRDECQCSCRRWNDFRRRREWPSAALRWDRAVGGVARMSVPVSSKCEIH